jgi:hypothetical protein
MIEPRCELKITNLCLKDFAKEYVRLSMLGVRNINNMTECTSKLPFERRPEISALTVQKRFFLP